MPSSIQIRKEELLSRGWATLKRYTVDLVRRDGKSSTLIREVFAFGDGATVLPYDPVRHTVLLVRQFRLPTYLAGGSGFLIETCAGLIDDDDPKTCARREAEEELGYRLKELTHICTVHSSPGTVAERISLFVAPYSTADRVTAGGGKPAEGEDIEVLELPYAEAYAMIGRGEIIDAKTVILLQHLKIAGLAG